MRVFKKDNKEKTQVIIGIDYSSTPIGLLRALRFMVIGVCAVAWAIPLLLIFLYLLDYVVIFLILIAGMDMRVKGKSFGWWYIVYLVLLLIFGSFGFSGKDVVQLIGAYVMSAVFLAMVWHIEREMKRNEDVKEVFTDAYIK